MNIKEKIFSALNGSENLTKLLAKDSRGQCIYHARSPDAGSYPILIYSIISDVPAVTADATELERKITLRIHIVTKDGAFEKIYREVVKIILSLGFVRVQATEFFESDEFIKVADFRARLGVDE